MQQLSKAFSRQQSMECSRRSTFQKLFPANGVAAAPADDGVAAAEGAFSSAALICARLCLMWLFMSEYLGSKSEV
jgi:hypothetical protein